MPLSATVGTRQIAEQYIMAFTDLLGRMDLSAIDRIVERLKAVRDAGHTVYVAGNGGSASTATHWVNDLGKATKRSGHHPMRVMSLTDNSSWLTALGNDEGYERVFAGQLENFCQEGDLLIVISASGNSPNLVSAVQLAASRNMATVGLLGFDGGILKSMLTDFVWLETEIGVYGLVETGHALVADVITSCLMLDYATP